jgi:uncharacterized protein YndB with AHSA1/START domain
VDAIRREIVLAHPPERVWRALTDPAILALWMMETTAHGAPSVGQRFQFKTTPAPGFDGIIECEILEAIPARRLVYSWASGTSKAHPTTVSWTLIPEAGGTRLLLEHAGFVGLMGAFLRSMMGGGWNRKVTLYIGVALDRLVTAEGDVSRMDRSSIMACTTRTR